MAEDQDQAVDGSGIVKGMPMFAPGNPEVLAKEQAELRSLESKGVLARYKWYFSKSGPGWMQSAMTLGGGSAFASLFAGAFLGYSLLWVQPLAMLMGVIMLSALAHQTLSVRERPFYAMKKHLSPTMAWLWAISAILATIIWHFPQYALAAGMSADVINAIVTPTAAAGEGFTDTHNTTAWLLGLGVFFLIFGTVVSWNYGSGRKGIKTFERIVKMLIWFVIVCFGIVVTCVAVKGGIPWGELFSGFLPYNFAAGTWNIPFGDDKGIDIMIAALSAAVGINMTFLFGYSYLARGWGKEHRGLAKFDLVTGMLIPYVLATSLMVVATACTIYDSKEIADFKAKRAAYSELIASGATEKSAQISSGLTNDQLTDYEKILKSGRLPPMKAASMFTAAGIPPVISRLIFGLGIIGMVMNCITLHMLVSGFAACEIFGVEAGGWKYKLACLTPVPGFFGVIIWSKIGSWIAIPTSAVCLIMLPVAYIGFFALNNSKSYLGDEMPRGARRFVWNTAMLVTIGIILVSAGYYIYTRGPMYFHKIQGLFNKDAADTAMIMIKQFFA